LRQEWEEKLRRAEVDISVERAKIARDQVALQEKLQELAEAQARQADAQGEGNSKSGKQPRGRWLARLGLKDTEGN
jgi:hypothetical protein